MRARAAPQAAFRFVVLSPSASRAAPPLSLSVAVALSLSSSFWLSLWSPKFRVRTSPTELPNPKTSARPETLAWTGERRVNAKARDAEGDEGPKEDEKAPEEEGKKWCSSRWSEGSGPGPGPGPFIIFVLIDVDSEPRLPFSRVDDEEEEVDVEFEEVDGSRARARTVQLALVLALAPALGSRNVAARSRSNPVRLTANSF